MTEYDIRSAWQRIRKIDNTIPDDVLDFMKTAALEKLHEIEVKRKRDMMREVVESPNSRYGWKRESSYYRSWKFGMRDLEDAYNLEMKYKEGENE